MLTRLFTILAFLIAIAAQPLLVSADDQEGTGLHTLNGQAADWQHYLQQGRWLLVKIWASNCVICNQTAHEIVDLQQQRGPLKLLIVGIALSNGDDLEAIKAYIARHGLTFDNLLDNGETVAHIYQTSTGEPWGGWTPTFLLYNPSGDIAAKNIGPVRAADIINFIDNYTG